MSVDDELVVPVQSASVTDRPQRYTLRSGDTLVTVADRFNVSLQELRRWNSLSSSSVRPGRVLYVAEPVRLAPSVRARGRSGSRGKSGRGASHASSRSSKSSKSTSRATGSGSKTRTKKRRR
jgi:membrane-bound lytic murein transglycosylase D